MGREWAETIRESAAIATLDEAGSTNDELARRAVTDAAAWPDLSVVVTDTQTNGRGRLGRVWVAPPGECLAISVLVRPATPSGAALDPERFGWLPLLAGAAMTRALRRLTDDAAIDLKWPNDVLTEGRKLSGILSELLPDLSGVVIGAGVNVTVASEALPTPTSSSLLVLTGERFDVDAVASAYLREFRPLYDAYLASGGDAERSGLRAEVRGVCGTLGSRVRVELPGGADLVGVARDIDGDGRLVVEDENGRLQSVAAGDVTHLRY